MAARYCKVISAFNAWPYTLTLCLSTCSISTYYCISKTMNTADLESLFFPFRRLVTCMSLSKKLTRPFYTLNGLLNYSKLEEEQLQQISATWKLHNFLRRCNGMWPLIVTFHIGKTKNVMHIYFSIIRYPKAIQIYEEVARQSLRNNLLKYGARGHLLNAGLCHLCKGDVVAITNALEIYEALTRYSLVVIWSVLNIQVRVVS